MPSYAKFDQWLNTAGVAYNNILNIVSNVDNTIISAGAETEGSILSVAITPSSNKSKILLIGGFSAGIGASPTSPNIVMYFGRTIRGFTENIGRFNDGNRVGGVAGVEGQGYSDGNVENYFNVSGSFLDSPSTTASITYSLRYSTRDGGMTIGKTADTRDATYVSRTYHTIIAMEIAQ
jgi:hypothetical protein